MMRLLLLALILLAAFRLNAQTHADLQAGEAPFRFVAGAGIGAPSGFWLMGGMETRLLALRCSGGSWSSQWYGIQEDVSFLFHRKESFSIGLSAVTGRFGTNPIDGGRSPVARQQVYAGIALDTDYSGFFLQTGMTHGSGDYPAWDPLFQFGYVAHF
jgi:hypothetical protein